MESKVSDEMNVCKISTLIHNKLNKGVSKNMYN